MSISSSLFQSFPRRSMSLNTRPGWRVAAMALVASLGWMAMARSAAAQTESVLVNFTGTTGAAPGNGPSLANLIQASDGNFYGTTYTGGANNLGTVFKVSATGTYTVLHSFATGTSDGQNPNAGLVQGTDGNFYGTTYAGGSGYGTVFEITPSGTFSVLHTFSTSTANGSQPRASLVQGTDGYFYGTTEFGGATGNGSAFKINSSGTFTLLHSFSTSVSDGEHPIGGLVQATDGNFYGTTYQGGANNRGTVYKMTTGGTVTLVYSFSTATTSGYNPFGSLVVGTDGNFYGTTSNGGLNNLGTVFKVSSGGTFTLLHSFSTATTDGQNPSATLVMGSDGNFYGATSSGGAGYGTLFQINAAGSFGLLHSFSSASTDGEYPGGLVQGMDGNFYGVTSAGGTSGDGIVLKQTASSTLSAPVVLSVPSTVTPGSSFTLSYSVTNATSETMQQCFATNTAGDTTGWKGTKTASTSTTNVSLTAPSTPGTYTYTLTCGGTESSQVTLNAALATPSADTVSPVYVQPGSTAGVTVTATESGSAGAVTGVVVTFSVTGSATGSFSSATCTMTSSGSCSTTYIPTGALATGTYTNDIQASFSANTYYAAATANSTLTVVSAMPTVAITPVTVGYQVTMPITVTATESGSAGTASGNVVTFGVTGPATGSFNPATCTISNGSCTTTYVPTGSLAFGTYSNDITASFSSYAGYVAASASSTLMIDGESIKLNFTGTSGAAAGASPYGNLIQASDGNYYGTTSDSGTNGTGTVFKLTPAGVYTLLHTFSAPGASTDGNYPLGGLVQGSDGNFYGTAEYGGTYNYGAIFKITSTGTFTVLHSFTSPSSDGAYPSGTLVQGTDSNFYGTTGVYGNYYGTVYKISSSGSFTLLHTFTGATTDGGIPVGGLVQGTDGSFYGTTQVGGTSANGTVYKITSTGTFTLLYSFSGTTDGQFPMSALVQGGDGSFYGTTSQAGGANGYGSGTVFKITSTGALTVLHTFALTGTDGAAPNMGLVEGSDGNFYGTTPGGGANGQGCCITNADGALFEISSAGTFTLLHSFSDTTTDGENPDGGLVQGADGNFYGTTSNGGANGNGTVFKLATSPALAAPIALTVPASVGVGVGFTLSYSVANAHSQTVQRCFATNTAGDTTVWTGIKTGSTTVTNVSLTAPSIAGPYTYTLTCGGMESSQVTLNVTAATPTTATVSAVTEAYGSTSTVTVTATESGSAGAVTGDTVTFSVISPATGSFSSTTCTLSSYGTCSVGYYPTGTLAQGTYANDIQASFAGSTLYSPATATSTLTITGTAPTVAITSVITGYGSTTPVTVTATESGTAGTANGSVVTFGVTGAATGSFNPATCTIANGSCTTTYVPTGTLAIGTYTNDITASFAVGGAYTAASATSTLTLDGESLLLSFTGTSGAAAGANPEYGNLIQASDGNFYGTTRGGGTNGGYGTVFKVSSTGTYTLLHTFSGSSTDGATPNAGLVQGTDGNLYGTTSGGGASGYGTVFEIAPTGTYTLLHSFSSSAADGEYPYAGLVQGTDGNFYGTTNGGGLNGYGTVFKISSTGTFTLLYSFSTAVTDGRSPYAGLVQGADGNFYGTTTYGGNGYGTVFKITPAGAFTLLHAFTTALTDGEVPYDGLVQGADGSFYGTTVQGGAYGDGTVFKITPTGTLSLLHSFAGGTADGGAPNGSLVLGTDGNFYGTTLNGGTSGAGTLFKISSAGAVTLLHLFTNTIADGEDPYGGLVQGADGSFYGMTYSGGKNGYGTVFRLATSPVLSAPVTLSVPSSVTIGAGFTLSYTVANAPPAGTSVGTLQQCFATNTAGDTTGWTGVKTGSATSANASLTAPSSIGTYTYTLTCGGMESSQATLTVIGAPTTTTLSSSANPVTAGNPVTFTATVSSSSTVNAGTVTFVVNDPTVIPGCSAQPVSNGTATCTTTFSSPGPITVTGTYNAGGSFAASTSTALSQGVSAATPTITFSVPTHHTIDAAFNVSASSNSSGSIAYSLVSGPASVIGSTVTLTGAGGTVQLMASQTASGIYGAASLTISFNVVAGSVWLGNGGGSLSIFGSDGAALANVTGGGLGTIATPLAEAFDSAGNLWIASANGVSAFTENGVAFQSAAFTGGGIASPVSLAVDGAGLIWVANGSSTVSVLNNSGSAVSPSTGYPATATGTPGGLAIDLSGNVWVTNQSGNTVTEMLGAATPAAPPSTALANGTTGGKP